MRSRRDAATGKERRMQPTMKENLNEKINTYPYTVSIDVIDGERVYVMEFPDFPKARGTGKTLNKAMIMAYGLLRNELEKLIRANLPMPEPRVRNVVETKGNCPLYDRARAILAANVGNSLSVSFSDERELQGVLKKDGEAYSICGVPVSPIEDIESIAILTPGGSL